MKGTVQDQYKYRESRQDSRIKNTSFYPRQVLPQNQRCSGVETRSHAFLHP